MLAQVFGYDNGLIRKGSLDDMQSDIFRAKNTIMNCKKLQKACHVNVPTVYEGIVAMNQHYQIKHQYRIAVRIYQRVADLHLKTLSHVIQD